MSPTEVIRRHRWFILIVVIPVLLSILYYGFWASDQYVSESSFVVKSPSERSSQLPSIASLIQTTGLSSGQEQTNEVMDYIQSRNALADLEQRAPIRAMFNSSHADFLSRYPAPFREDRFENLYRFYGHMIETHLNSETGVAILQVRAFSAEDAQKINALLLEQSERLINRLNDKAQHNAITEAEQRVADAERRVRAARMALTQYRNQEDLLDPAKQAASVLEISNKLVADQAAAQAQLDLMQRATPANPAIPALRERIAAIGRQIDAQNGRAVGTKSAISTKMAAYENLQLEQEFGTQMLTAANASLEQARTDAARQHYYLETVVAPNRPDLALLPNRIARILTVLAVTCSLYLIGWMLIVGILEHSPEG